MLVESSQLNVIGSDVGYRSCAPLRVRSSHLKRSGMDHTVFTLQIHHTCLYLVHIHQTAPPLASDNSLLLAAYTHLSTP